MTRRRSLPRSLATSVVTAALDLGLFLLLALLLSGTLVVVARWISGAAGALSNFVINRRWAFAARGARDGKARDQLARYAFVALGAVTLATFVFALLKTRTHLDLRIAHLASMALVWAAFTYPLLRVWVFARR